MHLDLSEYRSLRETAGAIVDRHDPDGIAPQGSPLGRIRVFRDRLSGWTRPGSVTQEISRGVVQGLEAAINDADSAGIDGLDEEVRVLRDLWRTAIDRTARDSPSEA